MSRSRRAWPTPRPRARSRSRPYSSGESRDGARRGRVFAAHRCRGRTWAPRRARSQRSATHCRRVLVAAQVSADRRAQHPLSRSEEHTSELQSRENLVCRLLLEKKKKNITCNFNLNKKKKKIIHSK